MVRAATKPYQRSTSETYRKGNPDAPGSWKHDLHQTVKSSLAARISSSSRPSLLDRISGGQGRELLPGTSSSPKLHGFGAAPPVNPNHVNAGVELLPVGSKPRRAPAENGRLVQSGLNAALGGGGMPRRELVRPVVQEQRESVSIMGAARGSTWVRVDNLAAGTTAEDVLSAFAPAPMLNASVTSPLSVSAVSIEIEFPSRSAADEVISRYHGAVADGKTLSLTVIRQGLADRMGGGNGVSNGGGLASRMGGGVGPVRNGAGSRPIGGNSNGQELLPKSSGSKMYSDTILASDPHAAIITLANAEATRSVRTDAWLVGGPSLSQGVGSGRGKGRGQIGGGSYADMMVD